MPQPSCCTIKATMPAASMPSSSADSRAAAAAPAGPLNGIPKRIQQGMQKREGVKRAMSPTSEVSSEDAHTDLGPRQQLQQPRQRQKQSQGAEPSGSAGDQRQPGGPPPKSSRANRSSEGSGAGHVPRPMSDPHDKQVTQALELRKQFSMGKQILACQLVGFDPANRDGVPINGDRCDELLGDICKMGFDLEEAEHDNVVVQVKPGDPDVEAHNQLVCGGSPYFADVPVGSIGFGTLSHSHLHQCIKNIMGGATASAPAGFCHDGRLSLELVRRRDSQLAKACETGLRWEVLSWKIREVPDALRIIQGACNRKSNAQMRETEMQAVSRLSDICANIARSSGDGSVPYSRAREMLAATMPDVANSNDFCGLLRFVVTLGAEDAPFLGYLRDFVGHRGQGRHVRATLFTEASKMPEGLPHLMVAMIVMAYTAPENFFQDGWSRFVNPSDFRVFARSSGETNEPTVQALLAEAILLYFQETCRKSGAYNSQPPTKRLDFCANVDSCVARFMTEKHMGQRHEDIHSLPGLGENFLQELVCGFQVEEAQLPAVPWTRPKASAAEAEERPGRSSGGGARGKRKPDLEPKIISYVEGKATNTQDVYREEVEYETVPWSQLTLGDTFGLELRRAGLMRALQLCHAALQPKMANRVIVRRSSGGEIAVLANGDYQPGELVFAPMVTSMSFIGLPPKRGQPNPNAVSVPAGCVIATKDGEFDSLLINPCSRTPPRGVTFAEADDKKFFLHPFWAMKRLQPAAPTDAQDEANMAIGFVQSDAVFNINLTAINLQDRSSGQVAAGHADHERQQVPLAANCREVKDGEALVLRIWTCKEKKKVTKDLKWDSKARKEPEEPKKVVANAFI